MILIIGGTAAYDLDLHAELGETERFDLDTPYGAAFPIFILKEEHTMWPGPPAGPYGRLAFASRHGLERLELTPPFVNARANIWAAQQLGVSAILSWNGVGAINPLLELHDVLVLDGVLDFTRARPRSFHPPDHPPHSASRFSLVPKTHHLFNATLRAALHQAARATTERAFSCGTYACSEGPRLETAAEIRAFGRMGADVVGMTLVPEVFLAQEVGIAYGSVAYVTNYATGIEPSDNAPRCFGADVAHRCLHIVSLAIAEGLLPTSGSG
jgi:5'-methylthioadenosine phosphorylase